MLPLIYCGTPRKASSRRSSRMREIASFRLSRHSSRVRPCPLPPGISGQYEINHSPSLSIVAVNSLCMFNLHFQRTCPLLTHNSTPILGQLVPCLRRNTTHDCSVLHGPPRCYTS